MRLEAHGYDVIEADDGISGLDAAMHQNPDLIVLDVRLPGMDGFKVARILKFDETCVAIPLIMLTAMSQADDLKMGLAVGADAYFTKPYLPQQLLDTISTLISRQPSR